MPADTLVLGLEQSLVPSADPPRDRSFLRLRMLFHGRKPVCGDWARAEEEKTTGTASTYYGRNRRFTFTTRARRVAPDGVPGTWTSQAIGKIIKLPTTISGLK